MAKRTRRNRSPACKAKVALAAVGVIVNLKVPDT